MGHSAAKTVMNRLIPALLPILIYSLSFGVAYAADAPEASDDDQSVAIVTTPSQSEEKSTTHVSLAGLGSLSWAARQPAQAWRVLLPIQPEGVGYADIRARCAVSLDASRGEAACP
jgi:hypothetical protein